MKLSAKVYEPMYEHNEKKYIRFTIPQRVSEMIERMHANRVHLLTNKSVSNPLEGHVLKVKVPFRYRRVMCEVKGDPCSLLYGVMKLKSK